MAGGKIDVSSSSKFRRNRQDTTSYGSKIELENYDSKNKFAEDITGTRSTTGGSLLDEQPEKPHLKRALKARHVNIFYIVLWIKKSDILIHY
jgi:amino acid permease